MKSLPRLFAVVGSLLCACARVGSSRPDVALGKDTVVSRADSAKTVVTTFVRRESFTDDELAARHLGRVEVALRSLDRPTQALTDGRVTLHGPGGEVARPAVGPTAVAAFDSLPSGAYVLRTIRIGYSEGTATVTVKDGCRTDVEVYLPAMRIGLFETPLPKPRIVITTC